MAPITVPICEFVMPGEQGSQQAVVQASVAPGKASPDA
jgi:hypothetical protein